MAVRIIAGWCFILLMAACSHQQSEQTLRAEKMSEALYLTLQQGEFAKAAELYDEGFFVRVPAEQWQAHLEAISNQLGNITAFSLMKKQTDTRLSGRFLIFEYQVKYERDTAWETLTYFVPFDDVGNIKLLGHKIDAPGIKHL